MVPARQPPSIPKSEPNSLLRLFCFLRLLLAISYEFLYSVSLLVFFTSEMFKFLIMVSLAMVFDFCKASCLSLLEIMDSYDFIFDKVPMFTLSIFSLSSKSFVVNLY